jgi:hypothetical protein
MGAVMEWTSAKATEVIKIIKDELWEDGYHIAIGGGLAWRGRSEKDLDLFVLPLFSIGNARHRAHPTTALARLEARWGKAQPFSSSLGEMFNDQDYLGWTVGMFDTPYGRIDVFVHPEV